MLLRSSFCTHPIPTSQSLCTHTRISVVPTLTQDPPKKLSSFSFFCDATFIWCSELFWTFSVSSAATFSTVCWSQDSDPLLGCLHSSPRQISCVFPAWITLLSCRYRDLAVYLRSILEALTGISHLIFPLNKIIPCIYVCKLDSRLLLTTTHAMILCVLDIK